MRLYDTHAHLNDPEFERDLPGVIERAKRAGVERINVVGWDIPSSRKALALGRRYPDLIRAAVGVHPNSARGFSEGDLGELAELAGEQGVVAVGEVGMDLYRDYASRGEQERALRVQLALARDTNLPVILHIRRAFSEIIPVLEEFSLPRLLFHAFSGGVNEALWVRERGYLISVPGVLVLGSKKLKRVIKRVGPACLVVETDCPYMSPVRGQRNEPANLVLIVEKMARVLEMPVPDLARALWENSVGFFGE